MPNEAVSFDEVCRLFGIVKTNSMGLKGLEARALYPTVSLLSHACDRNLLPVVGPGEAVAFKAVRAIDASEELTIR